MTTDHAFLHRPGILGLVEGTFTLVLLGIGMPLEYLADMPAAVTIVGSIHGALFVTLVAMVVVGMNRIPLPPKLTAAAVAVAVVPFGPFVVDRWLSEIDSGSYTVARSCLEASGQQ